MSFFFLRDLREGRTMASFHELDRVPVDKDKLIILVTAGANCSEQSFSNRVGTGSRSQVFAGQDEIRSDTVLIDTLSKADNLLMFISVCEQVPGASKECATQ